MLLVVAALPPRRPPVRRPRCGGGKATAHASSPPSV